MKKAFLILILTIIFVNGCAKGKDISFTMENLNERRLSPGIYYEYKYSDEELKGIKNIDADLILNDLIQNNVKLTDAWYKAYTSSCCPPNTNRCMQAIVEPVFLIKLAEETELENFVEIDEPKIGFCAYKINHYTIQ